MASLACGLSSACGQPPFVYHNWIIAQSAGVVLGCALVQRSVLPLRVCLAVLGDIFAFLGSIARQDDHLFHLSPPVP